jgi:hypothetical protein
MGLLPLMVGEQPESSAISANPRGQARNFGHTLITRFSRSRRPPFRRARTEGRRIRGLPLAAVSAIEDIGRSLAKTWGIQGHPGATATGVHEPVLI